MRRDKAACGKSVYQKAGPWQTKQFYERFGKKVTCLQCRKKMENESL
ncbi:hypothetical protein STTU_0808 [Streptomyces sp. Tu6071]|nr:hypothetical protein STTU_0808 [Streptomyces sp. Tu6071]